LDLSTHGRVKALFNSSSSNQACDMRNLPAGYDLAIVGGGLAACVAIRTLAKRAGKGTRIAIISNTPILGLGLAYATNNPSHLLNVHACRMSLCADDALEFVRWAKLEDPNCFAPRPVYGAYVRAMFEAALANAQARGIEIDVLVAQAGDISVRTNVYRIEARSKEVTEIHASALLLAEGPPALPSMCAPGPSWLAQPWPSGVDVAALDQVRTAVILGTGLTAIDVALSLLEHPQLQHISMLSLDGLLPEPHSPLSLAVPDISQFTGIPLSPAQTLRALKQARQQCVLAKLDAEAASGSFKAVGADLEPSSPPCAIAYAAGAENSDKGWSAKPASWPGPLNQYRRARGAHCHKGACY
jgi:uncharacterized NAD(P)/FAD-binding protein YdhS